MAPQSKKIKPELAVLAFQALGHETRLAAFRALVKAGPDGLPAGKLADKVKVPPQTLSFHLKELAAAGLVSSTREGRVIRYRPEFDRATALIAYLIDDCCGGACNLTLDDMLAA